MPSAVTVPKKDKKNSPGTSSKQQDVTDGEKSNGSSSSKKRKSTEENNKVTTDDGAQVVHSSAKKRKGDGPYTDHVAAVSSHQSHNMMILQQSAALQQRMIMEQQSSALSQRFMQRLHELNVTQLHLEKQMSQAAQSIYSTRINQLDAPLEQYVAAINQKASVHGYDLQIVNLNLPAGNDKLGIGFADNEVTDMPEFKGIAPQSPIYSQIPVQLHGGGWYIVSLISTSIGHVQPKTAEECVSLFTKSRNQKDFKLEIVLMQVNRPMLWNVMQQHQLQQSAMQQQPQQYASSLPAPSSLPKKIPAKKSPANVNQSNSKPSSTAGNAQTKHNTRSKESNNAVSNQQSDLPVTKSMKKSISSKSSWRTMYEHCKEYKATSGNFHADHNEHPHLVDWMDKQRQLMDEGNLDESKFEELDEIGFTWASSDWQKMLEKLIEYKKSHGTLEVHPKLHRRYPDLVNWVEEQRLKGKDKLKRGQVMALDEIGFKYVAPSEKPKKKTPTKKKPPPPKEYPKPTWDEMYESMVRFKDRTNGMFPLSGHLHDWFEEQKETMEHLSSDQIQKLQKLGAELTPTSVLKLREAGVDIDDLDADDVDDNVGEVVAKSKSETQTTKKMPVWWLSPDAAKLFGIPKGEDVVKGLNERIELLRKVNQSVDGWKSIVPNDGIQDSYNERDILFVRHKALYLIKSYLLALENMNMKTWNDCCLRATGK